MLRQIFLLLLKKKTFDVNYKTNGLEIITRNDLRWQRKDIKTTQLLFTSLIKTEAHKLNR